MNVHMTLDEARAVERLPIQIGNTYTFFSDCVNCETKSGNTIRSYSAQPVTVIARVQEENEDEIGLLRVRAANGDEFDANDGELNGWIFDTGQWVGPRIN